MNKIKRYLGWIWIALGAVAFYYLVVILAFPKFEKGGADNLIPAMIYTFLLGPLVFISLVIFGKYCLTGEYEA